MTHTLVSPDAEAGHQSALRVPLTRTRICREARQAASRVLRSGWVTTGPEVLAFEHEFADHVGASRALAVSSCTAAIELALRAMHLPPGSRVLLSTLTFCGAASAIHHAGHVVVLVDVDPVSGMPCPETVSAAVSSAGPVEAMVIVHLGGLPSQVREIAEAAGLPLERIVEDAAHALGTWVGDEAVGTISRATCFSFYATKNLPIGEGGMITTDDDELADEILQTRLHGMSADAWKRYQPGGRWRYDVQVDGLKANMTDLQAAIGREQLRRFDADQTRRAAVARRYDERLDGIRGIAVPPRTAQGRHAWHLYAVRVRAAYGVPRDALVEALRAKGIGTFVHFPPIHEFSWFAGRCVLPNGGFPGAAEVFSESISLPMDQVISDDEVDFVCSAIEEIGGAA